MTIKDNEIPRRHGDVDLIPAELPDGAKESEKGQITIALGEATGHHHTIYPEPGVIATLLLKNNRRFLKIENGFAMLKHQEHHALRLPPGVWEIGIENEEDPFEDEIRQVQD